MSKSVEVRKIEVVQAIQNAANDVPLVTQKLTFARVYLEPDDVPENSLVSGRIQALDDSGNVLSEFSSISPTRIRRRTTLREQRLGWSKSLNFRLPDEVWESFDFPSITIRISSLNVHPLEGSSFPADSINGTTEVTVSVVKDPQMKCRMVSFRHRDLENMEFIEPTRGEVEAVKRFVESAFPVGRVYWSKITADAPRRFLALSRVGRLSVRTEEQVTRNYMRFFMRLLMLRDQDILVGRDRQTLYFGLIYDPSNRFGGAAMDSPQFPAPHVVALAASETEGQVGAHEIAHVMGRRHPGVPHRKIHGSIIGQRREDKSKAIHQSGYLSRAQDVEQGTNHLGLDTRYNRINPKILPHDQWFDLMTYRYPSWVSDATYKGLKDRLAEISNGDYEPTVAWTVIGEYDLLRKTARIRYLGPSSYMTPMPVRFSTPEDRCCGPSKLKLAWSAVDDNGDPVYKDGKPVYAAEEIYIREYAKLDGSSTFGVFQHTLVKEPTNRDYRCLIPKDGLPEDPMDEIFERSLDSLFVNKGSLSLMFNDLIVDQVGGRDIDSKLRELIEEAAETSDMKNIEFSDIKPDLSLHSVAPDTKTPPVRLYYSVDDGGYYLEYRWVNKTTKEYRATTAVFCRRRRKGEMNNSREPVWQTVAVSQRLKNRIWISPVFFDSPPGSPDPDEYEHDRYGDIFYGGNGLNQQELDVLILTYVGFHVRVFAGAFDIGDCQIVSCGNRPDDVGHVEYPGSTAESKNRKRKYWYEDTATECPEKWSQPG